MPRSRTSGAGCSTSSVDPGERAVRFLNNLTHTGDYSGQPFHLRTWQETPLRKLFGTLRPDGTRRYRKTFWALPRKQGKTEIVAGGGLFLLMGQGRTNQQIYTASGDAEQASLIFRAACQMIRNDPALDAATVIYDGYKRIDFPAGNSFLKVLSSVPKSKHGLGPTAVLIDEFHVVDEELVNVLTTGFGARKDPLTWMITTAGWNRHSLCFDEWQYAVRVRDGLVDDPTYLPVIYAADPEDDWHDEAVWRKAMPALGDFCNLDFIREEHRKAVERPRFENAFRQLYMNQWTEQAQRWIGLDAWDACGDETLSLDDYEGRPCYGGLDLSSKHDLTALCLAFPNDDGGFDLFWWFWLPGDSAAERERVDRVPYPQWVREGRIVKTEGKRIDYDEIRDQVEQLHTRFQIVGLGYDPQHAGQLANQLYKDGDGVAVVEYPNTFTRMNEPSAEFERLVAEGLIKHDGHPVARWNVANAAVAEKSGLILPSKIKSSERIDGVVAAVMAIGVAIADGGHEIDGGGAQPMVWFG